MPDLCSNEVRRWIAASSIQLALELELELEETTAKA